MDGKDLSRIVATSKGLVRGTAEGDTYVFKGVPYAQPPIGDLRFAPPREMEPWEDVLACDAFASCATQAPSMLVNTTPSEDCLYLNIWTPSDATPDSRLPVVFWIHGGGYFTGCGTMDYYDGSAFAAQGVILVTINYRLGALGFLGLKTLLEQYGTTGNWGTLDQIAALQWTHGNIANFGGDPENITIDGESAGSFSVSNLIMSPLAKGLFKRAIMQSGSIFSNKVAVPFTKSELQPTIDMSREFAAQFGADDSPEGLEKLRSIDAMGLWQTGYFSSDATEVCPLAFWPTLDGHVLPQDPAAALKSGAVNGDEFIIGFNQCEGAVFISEKTTPEFAQAYIERIFPDGKTAHINELYPGADPVMQVTDVVTYAYFKAGETLMKDELARLGKKVYGYQFDYTPGGSYPMKNLGAHHAVEILYSFATSEKAGLSVDDRDRVVAEQMHTMWVNFAKTGSPNPVDEEADTLPQDVPWIAHVPGAGPTYYFDVSMRCTETEDVEKIALYMKTLFE